MCTMKENRTELNVEMVKKTSKSKSVKRTSSRSKGRKITGAGIRKKRATSKKK